LSRPCQHTTESAFERAALFVLGLLDPNESAQFEKHQRDCLICSDSVTSAQEVLGSLALACPPATPDKALKQRILASITKEKSQPQVWKSWAPTMASSIGVVRQHQGKWETVHPGIHVKQLNADPTQNAVTMLIRMDAGSEYIPHRHAGPEQCFVLEGDLREDDLTLHAGDYQYAPEGTIHGVQWTERGCLLLIICSQQDELLV
jgi:anti-sigma factor ChrR (cupin superfamily)